MDSAKIMHPQKWRETSDPFSIKYNNVQIKEILGYPHAGNDVFHVRCAVEERETTAYVKVARQQGAAIGNEVSILMQLEEPVYPKVLDWDRDRGLFSVTADMPGLRLSAILGENGDMASISYMEAYGESLAKIHSLKVSAPQQADRRFYHRPTDEVLEKLGISFLGDFFDRKPENSETVFCHGDFHYANLLWQDGHISAILDFELAGYGNRDFDIAWAIFLRPGQKFLKTEEERELFLKGYQKYGECNIDAVKYYMAQCYAHFLWMCWDDEGYCKYVQEWLKDHCI